MVKLTRRVLHHRAKPVDFRYPERNRQLQQEMHGFMIEEKGIGLAATQIGIRKRVFVMEIDGCARYCFNPEILQMAGKNVDFDEGCLSFPGEHCILARPEWVEVKYQDYLGSWYQELLSGVPARCFQHELDHLDGITMWDRHKEQHAEQSRN